MYWLSPLFYTEEKFGPLEKRIKNDCINPDDFFFPEKQPDATFLTTKGMKKF